MKRYRSQFGATAATSAKTISYGGGVDGIGVTSGTPKVYVIFWGSQWGTSSTDANGNLKFSNDSANAAPYLQQFYKGLGTGGELWSGVMTQYCDGPLVTKGATSCASNAPHVGYPTGGALAGVWYDNSAAEPTTATASQIAAEAIKAASHFGNTTASSNRYVQYIVVSPSGLHPDGYNSGSASSQQFCAWHDWNGDTANGIYATSTVGDIAFTNLPYLNDVGAGCGQNFVNAGTAGINDGWSIIAGHEYAETVTDQNPAGGWTNSNSENGDECAWVQTGQGASANVVMGNGNYAMQSTWSNDTNRCDITHAIVGNSVNATPVASSGSIAINNTTQVSGTLSASDTDGDTLKFAIVTQPAHGTALVTNISTGAFTYTPTSGYVGNDSFTFNATDNAGNASNVATESITAAAPVPVPVPVPTGSCPAGYTTYTHSLSRGQVVYEPNNRYYLARAGLESGLLSGPTGTNFNLGLYLWSGFSWRLVGSSIGATSTESINLNGPAGYYTWGVYGASGSGTFTLCIKHP